MSFYQGYEIVEYNGLPYRTGVQKLGIAPLHWHEDVEILFVLDGRMQINVGAFDRVMKPGDIILINSNQIHRTLALENMAAFIQVLQFQPHYAGNYGDDFSELDHRYFSPENGTEEFNARFRSIMSRLLVEMYQKKPGYKLITQSCLNEVLCMLIRNCGARPRTIQLPENTGSSRFHHTRIQRIVNFVEHHYSDRISLKDIAAREGVHENYLSRLFRRFMGCTFQKYLNNYRLQQSLNLLINSDDTITEIADKAGFADIRTFIHVFKGIYDMPPSRWRKMNMCYLRDSYDRFVEVVQAPFFKREFNINLEPATPKNPLGFAEVITDLPFVQSLIAPYMAG